MTKEELLQYKREYHNSHKEALNKVSREYYYKNRKRILRNLAERRAADGYHKNITYLVTTPDGSQKKVETVKEVMAVCSCSMNTIYEHMRNGKPFKGFFIERVDSGSRAR